MTEVVELHAHSCYSLLDGADRPETLVARAAELEMPALALTDHNALYGVVRFAQAAAAQGIRPIFGAELTLEPGYHLTLLVEDATGWANLCRLISLAQHNRPKGAAALPVDALPDHTQGLIALSGCRQGEIAAALLRQDREAALHAARRYRALFGPAHFLIELQHHLRADDDRLVEGLVEVAGRVGLHYVATNNVHYARREGRQVQDVLVCIRERTTLAGAGSRLRPNSEFYLKPARQLQPLFPAYPAALTNTLALAERCRFTLRYGLQELPAFPTPGLSAAAYLRQLCEVALPQRYAPVTESIRAQLEHELTIIDRAGLANYFLIVWDIVRFSRAQGIRGQGRGSAANSLVAYLLEISPIDPLAHHLVFERFLSAERALPPDIDLDFDAARREEVIQYVYQRYGLEHAAMACTLVTFRAPSALQDVGRVLNLPSPVLAEAREALRADQSLAEQAEQANGALKLTLDLCRQLTGYPRHLGLHNGGMLLTGAPLAERLPTEPAAMPGRSVVQWDKEDLETAGLVKIDLLGLRMLSAISEAEQLVGQCHPEGCARRVSQAAVSSRPPVEKSSRTLVADDQLGDFDAPARRNDLPTSFTDPAVYNLIASGSTLGIFQVESRAQAQLQPRLRPTCFNDLIIAISLIRPGPIQGDMVHPYLRRRQGLEPVSYAHPFLREALEETLGVILFQEQVLKVARDLAGFSPGQGELLRRALGSKHGQAAVEPFRAAFLAGASARGVDLATAQTVFDQLRAFGGYAFAKSHAAAFAGLVYQSAWLKLYHPAAFYVGLLNNQPMGFWSPAVLSGDARRHGVAILPVDLARSQACCALERAEIRLGFNYVQGFGAGSIARLIEARQAGPFTALADLCRRTHLPRRLVEHLILAGACDGWAVPRRKLLWELGQLRYREEEELALTFAAEGVELPPLSPVEALAWERSMLGLSTGEHVLAQYRPWLARQSILGSLALAEQPAGKRVQVAGLVVVHQAPPTAKGFHFLTLEDEDGLIDVIVRPDVYAQNRRVWRTTPLLVVAGVVQRESGVANVLAGRVGVLRLGG